MAVAAAAGSTGSTSGSIVFGRGTAPDRYDIWTVGATGKQPHRVTHSCMWDWWPDWSPDSTRVAFARAVRGVSRETTNIFVANANGTGVRQLTHERFGTVSHHPSWSADGRSIVFMSNRGPNLDRGGSLWVVSATTGGMRRLTTSVYEDVDPDW